MELYFLKSAACLAILMIFYKLLLEKENMHVFKRWYLLVAVLISFVIPWITFTTYAEPAATESALLLQPDIAPKGDSFREEISYLPYVLWSLYGMGVLFFGIKFILNLRIIILRIRRNPKIRAGKTTNVLLQERLAPHTFWDYIFLNKRKYEEKEIPEEVFQHEQAHADQRHSADILFMELLQIIFWFYPLLYLVKKAIRLNHEFLADRAVIKNGIQTAAYQKTLLAFSSNAFDSSLVNPINYQSIKKRFTVMRTNTSKKIIWAKSLVLLPLLAVLVYSFSTKETLITKSSAQDLQERSNYSILPSGDTQIIAEDINIRMISEEQLLLNGNTVSYDELPAMLEQFNPHLSPEARNSLVSAEIFTKEEFSTGKVNDVRRALYHYGVTRPKVSFEETSEEKNSLLPDKNIDQEKATKAMLREYDKLVKQYNSMENPIIKNKDLQRMNYLYNIMSPQQREKAEKRKFKVPPGRTDEKPASSKKSAVIIFESDTLIFKEDDSKARSLNFKAGNIKFTAASVPAPTTPSAPTVTKDGDVPSSPPAPPAPPVSKEGEIPTPPPPAPRVEQGKQIPAPPPPPPSPLEAVQDWIEEGALFFYNGNAISNEEALELVKKNNGKNLSVQVTKDNSGTTVRLSERKE